MSWIDCLGFCASLAVLASFCMTTIVPLRVVALAGNILFGFYGLLAHIYPVVFLHMILFPINLFKLARLQVFAGADPLRMRVYSPFCGSAEILFSLAYLGRAQRACRRTHPDFTGISIKGGGSRPLSARPTPDLYMPATPHARQEIAS